MKRVRLAPVKDALTPEERKLHLERLLLKRCSEIKKFRAERNRIEKAVAKRRKQTPKLLERCKSCGAFKFLMAAQKRAGR